MEIKLKKLIKQYLKDTKMMHLATVSNGKPWVCNVWFAADEDMNIYFFSSKTRRHSVEIANNPNVAGSMCLPQTPQDLPRGLQFEGKTSILSDISQVHDAISVYRDRIFPEKQIRELMENPDYPHVFYKIEPMSP